LSTRRGALIVTSTGLHDAVEVARAGKHRKTLARRLEIDDIYLGLA
jgi:hypothetical protein